MAAWHHVCRDVYRLGLEHHTGVSPAIFSLVVQGQVAGAAVHPHLRRHGDGKLRTRVVLGPPPPPQARVLNPEPPPPPAATTQ
mgnify:CR=1 FL=1